MTQVFLKLLNISITAGWIVLGVVLLRLFLKKSPKWISCLLWAIVGLRLMVPFHFESPLSLIPSAEVIPHNITTSQTPAINSGIPVVNYVVNPVLEEQAPAAFSLETVLHYAAILWLAGVAVMLAVGLISYFRLWLKVRASVKLQARVYECDYVDFPFILGIFRPRIYLPSGMKTEQLPHVLAHEYAHLKRMDHLWKPLGYLLLSVYWFNPLLWVAYILLTRDIEQACDEKVIATMSNAQKKGYSIALAECGTQRRMVTVCPVAFGEVGVKTRIKGVLNYKKPAFWLIIASVAACSVAAVCLLTDPFPCIHSYKMQVVEEATCTHKGKVCYTCEKCEHCYFKSTAVHEHIYNEGVVITEPSCSQVGYLRKSCTDCGKVTTVEMEKLPHTAGEVTVTIEPNCTDYGQGTSACTVCGTVFNVSVAPNGVHVLEETVVKAPKCKEAGEGIIYCTRCSYEEKCVYEALKHHFEYTYIISEEEGHRTWLVTCSHCGKRDINSQWIPGGGNSSSHYTAPNYWDDPSRQINRIDWSNGFPVIIWDPCKP